MTDIIIALKVSFYQLDKIRCKVEVYIRYLFYHIFGVSDTTNLHPTCMRLASLCRKRAGDYVFLQKPYILRLKSHSFKFCSYRAATAAFSSSTRSVFSHFTPQVLAAHVAVSGQLAVDGLARVEVTDDGGGVRSKTFSSLLVFSSATTPVPKVSTMMETGFATPMA